MSDQSTSGEPLVKTSDELDGAEAQNDASAQEEEQQPGHEDEGRPTPVAVAPGGAVGVGAPVELNEERDEGYDEQQTDAGDHE